MRRRRFLSWFILSTFIASGIYYLLGFSPETWVDTPGLKAEDPVWRWSMALAYVALGFFLVTLAIGPLNVLRRRHNPVHNPLRRDLGIWAAVVALAHLSVGIFVHTREFDLLGLFFHGIPGPGNPLGAHLDYFGVGNLAGFAQAGVLLFLVLISNNWALKKLGIPRWKNGQRLAYLAYLLVALHALSYQRIEERLTGMRAMFWVLMTAVAVLQLFGAYETSRKHMG